jgi:D-sedoheptulose 7-phosphate isomerase
VTDYTGAIKAYLDLEIALLQQLNHQEINAFMNALDEARRRGAAIYVMGNGGSGATASHMVNDFNKGVSAYIDPKFNVICLNDNMAALTAVANDLGYEAVFEFQLRGRVTSRDLVVGLSGSGNSPNVLNAVGFARSVGAVTAGLTGYDGGRLRKIVDISVHVPVMSMQITEDIHLILDHLMMAAFWKVLCGMDHVRG